MECMTINTIRAYISHTLIRFEVESGATFEIKGADYFLTTREEVAEATKREAEISALKIAFWNKGVDIDAVAFEWVDETRLPSPEQIAAAKAEPDEPEWINNNEEGSAE